MTETSLTPADADGLAEFSRVVKMTALGREPEGFSAKATPMEAEALARRLGLLDLTDFSIEAEIRKWRRGVRVTGRIVADVSQECIVTLDPVPDHIDETFDRGFLPERDIVGDVKPGQEVEIEDDPELGDLPDLLGEALDLGEIATEALILALDPYPRADGEDPLDLAAAPPGEAPISDEEVKPFAALAQLRDKMGKE